MELPGGAQKGHLDGPLTRGSILASLVALLKPWISEPSLVAAMWVNRTRLREWAGGKSALKRKDHKAQTVTICLPLSCLFVARL